jgi:hypothetical protein
MDTLTEYTKQAGLVLIGKQFREKGMWAVIEQAIRINQKSHRHTPCEKMLDAFISMLAGGHGLVEINTRVRPDPVVQRAFGRACCAEQSTISDTFDACTLTNVEQLRAALKTLLRQHGQCYRHDYEQHWQLLDIDLTGLGAGRQGEGVTKGYFAHQRQRRGRQLGRVLATHYEELVVERLYEGKRQLDHSFQELVLATEDVLNLTENKRKNTILRMDGGGGDDANINWALNRGYPLLTKVRNWQRAYKLAQTVTDWQADPKVADREVGWVKTPHAYDQPTRQVAIRHPKKKKDGSPGWHYHVLVFALTDAMLLELSHATGSRAASETDLLWAAIYAYDQRDGGLETQNRGDKQGLGLSHRNKRSFAAQEMLVLLAQLAHNVIIWSRNHLSTIETRFRKFGIQRMTRDVFQIDGLVSLSATGQVQQVTLNGRHPHAAPFQQAFG